MERGEVRPSERNKAMIRESWERLGKDKLPHGTVMFTRLFELDPALLQLFQYNTSSSSPQECLSSPEFTEHINKVMQVIDTAVTHLDELDSLNEYLAGLGRRHQAVGVKTNSFTMVGESFLYMLECGLETAYTSEIRDAWVQLYSLVVEAMSRGWSSNGGSNSK
ncbi:neuroglobin [Erpetoichthys calabaricus]|uniref:Nitrite reductase n=1 Tax=Erpetoichthys calabaricus TaxID=27687 RepID=A0A8C4SXX7_ERPCA|nr:neuroglobin [Erpetoichthys calabaricus]XP_028677369.1 neuroglobin [Erpetoichthys calabaricus]XP_051775836.1 neuroglobin [Erpetoichthys calabaricus]